MAGDHTGAAAALSEIWRKSKLDAEDEATIIAEFGAVIPAEDHRFRMERMLYADRTSSAERVAALAGAKELATGWAAVIRGDKDAAAKLDAVPKAQRSAGYAFAKAQLLRKAGKREAAAALLISAPRTRTELVDPDKWWESRRVLARQLFDAGKTELAYKLSASHAGENAANQIDAEFHAGWYALRALRRADLAAYHFARIAELAEGPISRSRAYYWLGRAADAGGTKDAKGYYEKAALNGTTFYGQLAAEKLGRHEINMDHPVPSGADRTTFPQREAVRALKRLNEAGFPQFSDALYLALADQLTSPGELALLAAEAQARGNHYLALKVGKIAVQRGIDVGSLSHPIGAIPADADISGSGKALAYAIARQESEFNVGAVSPVGALGLLQLMPATAAELAKKIGVTYSQGRLTTNAAYNAELGAAFLGQQLDRFDGSYILTFIGYNAGPRRADQWVTRYGDPRGKDLDTVVDWIERIPFTETRGYVQRVMENYQVYKMRLSGEVDVAGDLRNGRK
jgi:soluble lytic murein transglycosylase